MHAKNESQTSILLFQSMSVGSFSKDQYLWRGSTLKTMCVLSKIFQESKYNKVNNYTFENLDKFPRLGGFRFQQKSINQGKTTCFSIVHLRIKEDDSEELRHIIQTEIHLMLFIKI